MSDSLRDQLLKSGLVQKLKPAKPAQPARGPVAAKPGARAHEHPGNRSGKHKAKPVAGHAPAPHEHDLAQAYALRAKAEREERERAQREAERVAREKRERKQKLAELLGNKALNAADADVARHFPHGNKIRRIYCTPEQLTRLNRGELAVVQLGGRYLLVERDIALQAQAIQAEALVLLCDPDAPADDDVPAEIVW